MNMQNCGRLLASTVLSSAALVAVMGVTPALAQAPIEAAQPGQQVEEVVITGSRIRRAETNTPAPVSVIDSAAIAERGFTSAAQALNQISSIAAQVPQANNSGSNAGNGQQFPNLFGLGAGRTLTLINGRRMVTSGGASTGAGSNGGGDRVVDANIIPTGLVKKVDVVQAGGAAVYGSDAIAGVVNYILNDKFEGIELDAQYGITSRNDYPQNSYRATIGKNFMDGRGNIAVDLEYAKTRPLYNRDRDEWTLTRPSFTNPANLTLTDGQSPTIAVDARQKFWEFNQNGVIFSVNPNTLGPAAYTAPSSSFLVRPTGTALTQGFQVAPDGKSLLTYNAGQGLTAGSFPGVPFAAGGDGFDYADLFTLYSGLERKNASLVGHYDITDHIKFSTEWLYAQTEGRDPLAGAVSTTILNSVDSGNGAIPFNRTNAFLTPAMIAALDATVQTGPPIAAVQFRQGGTLWLSKQWNDVLPTREATTTTDTWRGLAGFSGDFDALDRNFYWEASYSRAQTKGHTLSWGVDTKKFAAATVNPVMNSAGQIVCGVNADAITTNDMPGCVPLNIFGQGTASQAASAYVVVPTGNDYLNSQDDFLATLGGDIIQLPGGKAAFSLAYEYRKESTKYLPSQADRLGLTGSGVPTLPTIGSYDTNELSGEVLVPIFGGDFSFPFMKALEFNGQYRHVDNSLAGKENIWGANLRWDVGYGLTIRATRSRNFRAPSLAQLFAPTRTALGSIGGTDPCDFRAINSGTVPAVRGANCLALFTANPGYGSVDLATVNATRATAGQAPIANTAVNRLANFQSDASNFNSALITSGGNTSLLNEVSNTKTIGFVYQPTFIPGLTIVADRVDVDLTDGLSQFTTFNFLNTCVDSTTMPAAICSLITRDPTSGEITGGRTTTFNAGKISYRGEVYNINYSFPIGRFFNDADYGTLELAAEATHTTRLQASVTGFDLVRVDGTAFQQGAGATGLPDWQARFDMRYAKGPFRFIYTLNYLPQTASAFAATTDTTQFPVVKANYRHNISATYNFGAYAIRAGVNNLTDERPSYPTRNYGDILGRSYFVGLNAKF
jgi:iron complex outermembrane receptor protein